MGTTVGHIEQLIEKIVPRSWAEEWDNPGLLVGSSSQQVDKIILALDGTPEVVDEAIKEKAQLIIAHHPLMFKPLKNLRMDNQAARIPLALFRNGISFYAAHTNLDQSELSASLTFARMIGLEQREYLAPTVQDKLVKIVVFVPEDAVEKVRIALANEGVGTAITEGEHSECYSECFFQSKGEGMFRPLIGAAPAVGRVGELTRVPEVRLESVVEENSLSRAVRALHKAHPYEEPAYDLIPLKNKGKPHGYGVIGYLPEPMTLEELWKKFMDHLERNSMCPPEKCPQGRPGGLSDNIFPMKYDFSSVRLAGDLNKKIKKVAITNGSGGSFVQKAIFQGADLYITGDLDYHSVLDSLEAGMAVGELGHFLSEIPMMQSLYSYLRNDKTLDDVEIIFSSASKVPWVKRG